MMPRRPVAILVTEAEFRALASAAALHEVTAEDDPTPANRAEVRALTRLIRKIRYAEGAPS